MTIKTTTETELRLKLEEALKPGQIKSLDKFKIKPQTLGQLQKQIAQLKASVDEYNKILDDPKNIKNPKALNRLAQIERDATKAAFAGNKELDKLMTYLYKNCGNYIAAMQKADQFLYRGMERGKPIIHGRSWTDREPKDSHKAEQVAFDNLLKMLGLEALRSNSIFTSGDMEQAHGYGEVYMIFPFNSAKFTWSQTEGDLVIHHGDITKEYYSLDLDLKKKLNEKWKKIHTDMRKYAMSGKVSDNEAAEILIMSNNIDKNILGLGEYDIHELMTDIRQSYVDPHEKPFKIRFLKILLDLQKVPRKPDVKKFQADYKMTDKNFTKALLSENEIYISGEYIAINYKKHGEQLRHALGIEV